jgi:hypothetical protein
MRSLLLACALLAWSFPALGTTCPVRAGDSQRLAPIEGRVRLDWIDAHLARTAQTARVWTWGWGVGIGVATVGNLIPLAFVSPENRIDWYTGAATTAIGVVPLIIAPLDVVADSRELHAEITASGETDVCRVLASAETRLERDAKNQADGQRWWLHAGNVALNTAVGLFLGLGFHHWEAGVFNIVGGSVIGEAIILTQPTRSIGDFQQYRHGDIGESPPKSSLGLGYSQTF